MQMVALSHRHRFPEEKISAVAAAEWESYKPGYAWHETPGTRREEKAEVHFSHLHNTPFALDRTRSGLWKPSGKSQFSSVRVGPYING
jgi:hypothetical protein